jgi:hypothetical protein
MKRENILCFDSVPKLKQARKLCLRQTEFAMEPASEKAV